MDRREHPDDEAHRLLAEIAERQRKRDAEAAADQAAEREARAAVDRAATLRIEAERRAQEEEARRREARAIQASREREDAAARKKRAEEERAASKREGKGKAVDKAGLSMKLPAGGPPQRGRMSTRIGGQRTMVGPSVSDAGSLASMLDSDMSSVEPGVDNTPKKSVSRKRPARPGARGVSCSRSRSRGEVKKARRKSPLVPGQPCVRCAQRGLSCVPYRNGLVCEECRRCKSRCVNPHDAGDDAHWAYENILAGNEPEASGGRTYGPVASPARGF